MLPVEITVRTRLTEHGTVLEEHGYDGAAVCASCKEQDWLELSISAEDGAQITQAARQLLGLPAKIPGAADDY